MPPPGSGRLLRAAALLLVAAGPLRAGAVGPRAAPLPPESVRPPRTVIAVPAGGPIAIDGRLYEPAWRRDGEAGFTQAEPLDGRPPTEASAVWVAFDRDNLYVAARLGDSRPDLVAGRLGRRDEAVESDWFTFGLDPYHDHRTGYYFAVNPSGSIMDGTLFNDEGKDPTWDGIWEWAARPDENGWTVEARVPFHQLRFKARDDAVWGIDFRRTILRKAETDDFVWVPKEESGFVSRFADLVGLSGIVAGRRLEISPYGVARAGSSPPIPGNPFRTGRELGGDAGFDLKAGLRSHLTVDATVNPDFGQVEVDPAVINISDQETYYQEKRPFFVEGASIFEFGRGGPNVYRSLGWTDPAFFYTRRIGRAPQGAATGPGWVEAPDWTTILAAAKITGKPGRGFSIGGLSALTGRESALVDLAGERSSREIEPPTHYGVVRALKESEDGRTGLGFLATSVLRGVGGGPLEAALARSALAAAADGWAFLDAGRTWVLSGWAGATRVSGSEAAMTRLQTSALHYFQRPDADYVEVDPRARSLSGWAGRVYVNKQKGNLVFNAGLGAMSPGFEANDLGFHTRGDVVNGHVETGYQSFHPSRLFRRWSLTGSYFRSYDFGGLRIGEYLYLDFAPQLLNYWTAALHLDYEPPKISHYLTRGGPLAYYPSGATVRVSGASDGRKDWMVKATVSYRYHPSGGFTWSLSGGLIWKPGPNFSLSVEPGYSYRFAEGQWITKAADPLKVATFGTRYVFSDIVQRTLPVEIRLSWAFTPRLGLQAYLQPYIGTGKFTKFKELRAARTFDFDVYGSGGSTLAFEGGIYAVDPDGRDGPAPPISFPDPDFSLRSLRGTAVFRWEYRPGSMVYFVWTQRRADEGRPGEFDLWNDLENLLRAPGENVFLLKITYRFEL